MHNKVYADEVLRSGSKSWKDLSSTGLTRTVHESRERHGPLQSSSPQIISHGYEDYAEIKSGASWISTRLRPDMKLVKFI